MSEDEAWNRQVDEMVALSANLSDRDKVAIEYWAEGPGGWTPPVHWNHIARGVALRDGHDLGTSLRLFLALNAAMLDASIACWDAKRAFDYHRPCTAVRLKYRDQTIVAWGGPDQGTKSILGQDWQPYQRADYCTPSFPEYTSGHSTFSRAAREVLLGFSGSDALYDGRSRLDVDLDGDGELDWLGQWILAAGRSRIERIPAQAVVLRWPTLLEAADDAGYSRRLGGIHFQDGDLLGRQTGVKIGQQALRVTRDLWDGRRPGRQLKRGHGPSPASAAVGILEGPFVLLPD